MILGTPANTFRASPAWQPVLREIGLDAEAIFSDPRIVVWRSITERENCTLDATLQSGRPVRLHIKRYLPARGFTTPAEDEARGIRALNIERIPTMDLVGWGKVQDGRSFVITADLTGYRPADKALADGTLPFDRLLHPTADLAAQLHARGLHHRDLYLCHFFVRDENGKIDLRLIDAARVGRLPGVFTRRRWIVKDLAQFWYSTLSLPITDDQRTHWLARYVEKAAVRYPGWMRRSIERKARSIARHDARLRAAQPTRNVSIPECPPTT